MFKKGQSGNPGGRPKAKVGDRTLSEIAREHTVEAVDVLVAAMRGGESHGVKAAASTALLDRGWGRPAQSVTLSGDPDAPLHLVKWADALSDEQARIVASIPLSTGDT